jgi:hypothetical protein
MPGNKGKIGPGRVAKVGVVSSNLIARSIFLFRPSNGSLTNLRYCMKMHVLNAALRKDYQAYQLVRVAGQHYATLMEAAYFAVARHRSESLHVTAGPHRGAVITHEQCISVARELADEGIGIERDYARATLRALEPAKRSSVFPLVVVLGVFAIAVSACIIRQ